MRIYTVSDLHVDYPENMHWALSLSDVDYLNDILLIVGDLNHHLGNLKKVFISLKKKFRAIHFVPGNHDLWLLDGQYDCSLEKFYSLQSLCFDLDVHMKPVKYDSVSIVPLMGWCDFSFGRPSHYLRKAWRDFRVCQWSDRLRTNQDINQYFLSLNIENLSITN